VNPVSVVLDKKRGNPNWGHCKSYSEVRQLIKPYKFKTMKQYRQWVAENKPAGFPLTPYATYSRRNEWVSTPHFLGKIDFVAKEDIGITKWFNFLPLRRIIKQLTSK